VFNTGQFESARSGFADYTRDGETAAQRLQAWASGWDERRCPVVETV
jgi:hypothetical protein